MQGAQTQHPLSWQVLTRASLALFLKAGSLSEPRSLSTFNRSPRGQEGKLESGFPTDSWDQAATYCSLPSQLPT